MKKAVNNSGQSLVEMLVAISIVVVSLLGILVLVNRSLGYNKVASEYYTATYLAAEGIEIVKNFFDRSFLTSIAGNRDFYGWTGTNNIAPSGSYAIYLVDFDQNNWPAPISCPALAGDEPKQEEVRKLFSNCSSSVLVPLNYDSSINIYNYNTGSPSKFRRIIIIDKPRQFSGASVNLDYRVTSAVGWESRGGKFVVQLQDHFLPWKIP